MYVRVAEIIGSSDIQFKMIMAFIEKELLPKNIEAGQLSGEIFKLSNNACFVVSRFTSKSEADKIMAEIIVVPRAKKQGDLPKEMNLQQKAQALVDMSILICAIRRSIRVFL